MLLYNQSKEFIGIDEDDLKGLEFQNITELLNESNDFADLFVKKPGYIHNFKNFSWIDFILHSEADESKAIVHAKGKNYSCTLHISPFYFTSEQNGYAVFIKNLRHLKGAEDAQATKDLESAGGIRSTPATASAPAAVQSTYAEPSVSFKQNIAGEPELPNFEQRYSQELNEPEALQIPKTQEIDLGFSSTENEFGAPSGIDYNSPLTLDDDLMMDEEEIELPSFEIPAEKTPKKSGQPMLGDYVSGGEEYLSDLVKAGTYKFDPQVAANELGLPVDLIEEFIGDFIAQAHEFHDDLYASVNTGDFDNVQNLSHKLKGVAANLRVEDAFDTLSVVNVSKEVEEILPNLNHFYKIIARLEGKELPQESAPVNVPDETDYAVGIKQPEDEPLMADEESTYDDLLPTPEKNEALATETEAPSAPFFDDDDLYGDLLGGAESYGEALAEEEAPSAPSFDDDDLYGDLLGSSQKNITEEIPSVPEASTQKLTVDVHRTANELGISADLVNDFIQEFKEQIHIHQSDFKQALTDQNIQEVNNTATILKGMSDNLRLKEISEVLEELQKESDINNITEAFAQLQAYADQL
ncbi:MAG: Hpt domain-containing protein [Campylobacterales bacterium]|nr:Hpt domain-containing protein [Campylobacterales bacterium]